MLLKPHQPWVILALVANLTLATPLVAIPPIGATPVQVTDLFQLSWKQACDVENEPLAAADTDWKVVYFFAVECPLARLYGQRLNHMAKEYAPHGVRVVGVNSNPQDSAEDVRRYIAELDISFPLLKDHDQAWPRLLGATRTAEVFVLNRAGKICYQGRIDDQYEPGISRAAPQKQELRDALAALLAGRAPAVASTPPVGCLITLLKQPSQQSKDVAAVTFAREVAPILNRHCVECHREGEIGPFALTDYDEVVGWGEMMLEVIDQGRMPPWHADPQFGKFVGARHLPAQDRQTLAAWVAQGMPRGDEDDLPTLPKQVAGWQLPAPPDEEFAMRVRPFVVPAEGTVEYQYFVVDPDWKEERWVRAAQVAPGNAAVVHHSIVFVRFPDGTHSAGIGWLGGYVPGQRTRSLPPGHAFRFPAGSKLVFQMHYTPNGRATRDITKVGVWLSESEEVTHEVTTRVALNHDFEIPPGAEDHTVKFKLQRFARDSRLLGVTPHMHLRGKSFLLTARRGNRHQTLLHVPHYDFNWQHWYHFESPLELAEVSALEMQVRFDNSAGNPTNPNPNDFVTWGDQTWQEMAVAFFAVAHPRDQPRVWVKQEEKNKDDEAKRLALIQASADRFMVAMDRNGDGVVRRDEVSNAFRLFGFRQMDRDRNGRLQRSEVEQEAARRL